PPYFLARPGESPPQNSHVAIEIAARDFPTTEDGSMFGDYSIGDLGAIFAMQGFAGLILFSVYVLMALGLAIIFGQMGVINMAHGEFLTVGAYTTYVLSQVSERWAPWLGKWYFLLAIVVAFLLAGGLGLVVEHLLVRRLYRRPLDTLLATWGLSLVMQQT